MTQLYLVDDDADIRAALALFLKASGFAVESFASAGDFLAAVDEKAQGCLIADIRMPGMDGLELQRIVARRYPGLPVIIMTGHGDVPLAVRAMRAGAADFLEKPLDNNQLLASIRAAGKRPSPPIGAHALVEKLTPRERDVFELLLQGLPSKAIAHRLSISRRTVEAHRLHVMEKSGARNIAELVRLSLVKD
jgi:two-component system response regulator FixJ